MTLDALSELSIACKLMACYFGVRRSVVITVIVRVPAWKSTGDF